MVCLPNVGVVGVGMLVAPLLLVRGLGRRAAHWFVINHQRNLQKLSIRRRQRRSHTQKKRPCSEPLVRRPPRALDARIRPVSDPLPRVTSCQCETHPLYETPVAGRQCTVRVGTECGHYANVSEEWLNDGWAEDLDNNQGDDGANPIPRPRTFFMKPVYGNIIFSALGSRLFSSSNATTKEINSVTPYLADPTPDAREPGGRAGVSGHPLLQQPAPSHGLAPARPQNPSPQPVQLPTLAPPPVPKQFPGVGQPRLPAPPPQVPVNNQQFLDKPPTEMAPAVPGAAAPLQANQVERAERVPLDDGGTIELTPLYRSLYERPYFHIISRIKSKEILETAADGVFLIRPSKRSSEPLTLCLRYKNRTYNINIRCRPDGLFALGYQKTNEMTFRSIDDLVSTYTREPIKLQNGDRTLLTVPPPKFDHIYVKMPTTFNSNRK